MLVSQFKRGKDRKPRKRRTTSPSKLLKNKERKVKYNGTTYKISAPERSTRKGKKYQVNVTNSSTGKTKKVSWGAQGYSDYTLHKDKARRQRFKKRHGAIKLKDGSLAHKDPTRPAYYAYNYNW